MEPTKKMTRDQRIDEFTKACNKLRPCIYDVMKTKDQNDVANVWIKAALMGISLIEETQLKALPLSQQPSIVVWTVFVDEHMETKEFFMVPLV